MSEFKYIVFEDDKGVKTPVIFPSSLVHEEVARAICGKALRGSTPISAGFVTLVVTSAHGSSETLNLEAFKEDAQLINCRAYTAGVESGMEPTIERMLKLQTLKILMEQVGLG